MIIDNSDMYKYVIIIIIITICIVPHHASLKALALLHKATDTILTGEILKFEVKKLHNAKYNEDLYTYFGMQPKVNETG